MKLETWKLESRRKVEENVARDVACNHAQGIKGINDTVKNCAIRVAAKIESRHAGCGLIDNELSNKNGCLIKCLVDDRHTWEFFESNKIENENTHISRVVI